ncbi:hypothetical protein FNF28_00861 [Cafeteria roenbergensis]|uniref:Uncharacterized protein n=1 Tax=Cafeteria roenbergensis TaxID=33653 RepID=A0A5A8E5N0_CAFRO|nr:hypothetical protein FNF28_00861 [Cafeteria roenbergensis]
MAVSSAPRLAKAREETTRLMLSGWAMSSTVCPVQGCNNPLFSKPGEPSVMRCPPCGATFECLGEGQFRVNELDEDSPLREAVPAGEPEPATDDAPAVGAAEAAAREEQAPAKAVAADPVTTAADADAGEAEAAPDSPALPPGFEQRQRRLDLASRLMGQAMLRGMAMLGEGCPVCDTPFMRSRDGTRHCVLTDAGECTWRDGARDGGASTASPPAGAAAAASSGAGATVDAGISPEEAAAAFQDAVGGIGADEAAGPSARRAIEEASLSSRAAASGAASGAEDSHGMPARIDTDALMARAMATGASTATVERKQDEDEDAADEEESHRGGGLEAARRRRARQEQELNEAANAPCDGGTGRLGAPVQGGAKRVARLGNGPSPWVRFRDQARCARRGVVPGRVEPGVRVRHALVRLDVDTGTKQQEIVPGTPGAASIDALASCRSKKLTAFAESYNGRRPSVTVLAWDAKPGKRKRRTIGPPALDLGSDRVASLAFSDDGKMLVVQGAEPEYTLAYISLEKSGARLLAKTRTQGATGKPILTASPHPLEPTVLLLSGMGVMKMYRYMDDSLRALSLSLKQDPKVFLAHTWLEDDRFVAATDEGELLVFEHTDFKRVLDTSPADGRPIDALAPFSKGFIAGCDGGRLLVYQRSEDVRQYYKLAGEFVVPGDPSRFLSLSVSSSEDEAALVMSSGQAYLFRLANFELHKPDDVVFAPMLAPFHGAAPSGDRSVVALTTCVRKPIFVSAGADRTIRVWSHLLSPPGAPGGDRRPEVELVKRFSRASTAPRCTPPACTCSSASRAACS